MKFSKDFLEKHGIAESELESINKIVSDNPIDIYDLEELDEAVSEHLTTKRGYTSGTHDVFWKGNKTHHYIANMHSGASGRGNNTYGVVNTKTNKWKHVGSLAKCKQHLSDLYSKDLEEKYEGFKKLEGELKAKGDKNPGGLAAYIGRKKYGNENFDKHAEEGKKLKEAEELEETSKDRPFGPRGVSLADIKPKVDKKAEYTKAHIDGYNAGKADKHSSDNPHKSTSKLWDHWYNGYSDARGGR